MSNKNEIFEAVEDECRKAGVRFRMEQTNHAHHKVFVDGSSMIVLISGNNHKTRDIRVVMNVRRDIRRSIRMISNGK